MHQSSGEGLRRYCYRVGKGLKAENHHQWRRMGNRFFHADMVKTYKGGVIKTIADLRAGEA